MMMSYRSSLQGNEICKLEYEKMQEHNEVEIRVFEREEKSNESQVHNCFVEDDE